MKLLSISWPMAGYLLLRALYHTGHIRLDLSEDVHRLNISSSSESIYYQSSASARMKIEQVCRYK